MMGVRSVEFTPHFRAGPCRGRPPISRASAAAIARWRQIARRMVDLGLKSFVSRRRPVAAPAGGQGDPGGGDGAFFRLIESTSWPGGRRGDARVMAPALHHFVG
ncbi:MAG: hypothetical protein WKF75_11815 [Singulisphaera sp.]